MKYFANFPYTAESLKNEYRELCKKLHPDTGGNAEAFKNMVNEYEQIARNLAGTRQNAKSKAEEEEARRRREEAERQRAEEERERREWEEEQKRQREEEERAEAERRAKARPLYEKRCKKWAPLMEDLTKYREAEQKAYQAETAAATTYGYSSAEYKEACKATKAAKTTTNAARRRNLLKMAQHAFKGVKFSLKYDRGWGGGFEISWTDGPSLSEFKNKTDFDLFVSCWDTFDGMTDCAGFEHAIFTDFAEKYNGLSGEIEINRELSAETTAKMADALKKINPDFTDPAARVRYDCVGNEDIAVFLHDDQIREFFRIFNADFDSILKDSKYNDFGGRHTLKGWIKKLSEFITLKSDDEKKKEKPAEFTPRYGAALRSLFKLVGGRSTVFWIHDSKTRTNTEIQPREMIEALEKGQAVEFGEKSVNKNVDGEVKSVSFYGIYAGGYKVQRARVEKFAAAGYTINAGDMVNVYSHVELTGVTPETAAALRADLADVEKQRREWEADQAARPSTGSGTAEGAKGARPSTGSGTAAENTKQTNEAPAEGLRLIDIDGGGVAVVGNDWKDTYFNKRKIKANGAHWNEEAKQWQAVEPENVERLRAWFAMRGESSTGSEAEAAEAASPSTSSGTAEGTGSGTAKGTSSGTAKEAETASPSTGSGTAESNVAPLFEAVADFFGVLAGIAHEAAKYEGVTIPAATLERWQQETANGARTAAERFAEVCACLGALTPEKREKFDALGVIFWSLGEQLRQGANAETISTASDYARGQLFDLIDATQTPQQAAAVRHIFEGMAAA